MCTGQMLADVLTFTANHVERNEEGLKQLLRRVREDSTCVVFPIIDVISMGNCELIGVSAGLRVVFHI
uniref:Uncharacterized protein n=1 Tax=Glossina austeni TaxID=7395 RepID=A0A1A9VTT0_GLOAU